MPRWFPARSLSCLLMPPSNRFVGPGPGSCRGFAVLNQSVAAHVTRRPIPISHRNWPYRTSCSPPITDLGLSGVDFTDRAVGTYSKSRSRHYPRLPRKSVSVYPHEMSLKPLFPEQIRGTPGGWILVFQGAGCVFGLEVGLAAAERVVDCPTSQPACCPWSGCIARAGELVAVDTEWRRFARLALGASQRCEREVLRSAAFGAVQRCTDSAHRKPCSRGGF